MGYPSLRQGHTLPALFSREAQPLSAPPSWFSRDPGTGQQPTWCELLSLVELWEYSAEIGDYSIRNVFPGLRCIRLSLGSTNFWKYLSSRHPLFPFFSGSRYFSWGCTLTSYELEQYHDWEGHGPLRTLLSLPETSENQLATLRVGFYLWLMLELSSVQPNLFREVGELRDTERRWRQVRPASRTYYEHRVSKERIVSTWDRRVHGQQEPREIVVPKLPERL